MNKQLLSLFFILLFSPFCMSQTTSQYGCGDAFLDPGGSQNYPGSANSISVICPENPGDVVTVTFSSFNTEATWDGLFVYNGNSVSAPQISSGNPQLNTNIGPGTGGAFWGSSIPGPFYSTSPDGCLTFWFVSDTSLHLSGWEASVTCSLPSEICYPPEDLTVVAITPTTATLAWTEMGSAVSWEVLALPCGTPAPLATTSGTLSTTSAFTMLDLVPATCYAFYVRAVCSDASFSPWSQTAIGTTLESPVFCGGTFFDNGGASANYLNNSNSVTTICPENPGDAVTITFTSFDIEANSDGLYIFNGNSTASPQMLSINGAGPGQLSGAYWGTVLPGPFQSTSPDGCLTFWFISDNNQNSAGWTAGVTCGAPLNCNVPTDVVISDITTDSAAIGWTSTGIASEWELTIMHNAVTETLVTSSNPYTLTNLIPNSTYMVSVKGLCGSGLNTWSTPYETFTTLTPVANPMSVNSTLYTPAELVSNILIDNPCLEISNVSSSTGTNFGSTNGIGFFENDNPTFPLTSGIVLSTGNIANIPGPNLTTLSDGSQQWPGDAELEALMLSTLGTQMNSKNATSLEFDFTALNEFMSFNFLFASEEYGTFQCTFADAFAFLLTDLETGITTNLAVVPGTQMPVSVVTIRDDANNNACASVNPGYFDQYFTAPEYLSAANFNGQTQLMTASSPLVANHPYHIKLVIADRNDTAFDSAVFIEAGSFTSGPPQCSDKLQLVAFVDQNANGIKDAGEESFNHGSFSYDLNNSGDPTQIYSPFGTYDLFDADPANLYDFNYQLQAEYAAYYSSTATYNDLNVDLGGGTQIVNFPITLIQPYNDVSASLISLSPPRPDMTYQNKVVYTNFGVSAASGTITFTKDALVSITEISQTGTVANANGFTYNFTNLQPNETRAFFVTMSVPAPPAVNLDDVLTNSVSISAPANDINLDNNTFANAQIVVNSYDPNMVVESHGEMIDINSFSVNEYLYYTIYFQNVGTANAINIMVEDFLNDKLDQNTVVTMYASHNFVMQRKENHLRWYFNYIMLPGQLENENLSRGHILFKVKVLPGFQAGDIIPNTASIYFDSNPAVVTNTFNTIFFDSLGTDQWDNGNLVLFPNPANTSFTANLSNTNDSLSRISVFDMLGKQVSQSDVRNQMQATIGVSGLAKGIYIVEIMTQQERRLVRKMVIE